ncbi:hypothetical protein IAQ61_009751 [Plenodomus lingam]|uniref:uncharacterized protein n=1 Tax=Leptosphaeria maculans TaxID=5022 RepID=UPI00332213AC|nr:hypothetical protein IAQ61_009751 [Plenodomus lingam]
MLGIQVVYWEYTDARVPRPRNIQVAIPKTNPHVTSDHAPLSPHPQGPPFTSTQSPNPSLSWPIFAKSTPALACPSKMNPVFHPRKTRISRTPSMIIEFTSVKVPSLES